jgi:O-antigen/teichoic acid export membrane protein
VTYVESGVTEVAARRITRNAAVMGAAEVAGKFATLAWTVVAVRELGAQDYGAFSYAMAFALLWAALPSWGFELLLVQRGSAEPRLLPGLFAEVLVWRLVTGAVVFAVAGYLGVLSRPTPRAALALLFVLAATLIDDLFTDTGRAVAGACQRLFGVSLALVIQRLATALLGIVALLGGLGLIGLATMFLIGTLVGAVAVAESVRRIGVRPSFAGVSLRGLLDTARRSTAIAVNNVILMALFRIDQLILGAMKGDAAVGGYAAAYRLLETVLFLSWVVGRAVFPAMSTTDAPWQVRRGLERGMAAVAAIYVPFGCALLIAAGPVLHLLYGPGFVADGVRIVQWLAGAPLVFAIGYLGSFALLTRGGRWLTVLASCIAAGYNIALNLLLIPRLSGVGAAVATTTSYLVQAGVVWFLLRPRIGWVRLDRALLIPAIASAVMAVVMLILRVDILIEAPIGAVVYAAAWYGLARWRDPEQLALAKSMVPWLR